MMHPASSHDSASSLPARGDGTSEREHVHRGHVVLLPPNRVWRTYPGGATLDRIEGRENPQDTHFAEDWIASVTVSNMPGRDNPREGVSRVVAGGAVHDLDELIAGDPEYFLGPLHVARHGVHPMLLVKFLDPAIRLNFQAHPSRDFALARLGSASGKTEAYCVLGVRDCVAAPGVFMGFQHPPTRTEFRRMIEEQDVAAMEACFERIPLQAGDAVVIPGGLPHALDEGLFLIEIQEPTDFVVRYEFERAGYLLPEPARFMGRGIDFALDMIDSAEHPVAEIDARWRARPRRIAELGPDSWQEEVIGPAQTPCFRVRQSHIGSPVLKTENEFHIVIVSSGACTVGNDSGRHRFNTYDKFLVPAGVGPLRIEPEPRTVLIECYPPR